MELTDGACSYLNKISTEILENAERHGDDRSEQGNWRLAGFMARRLLPDQSESYDCHIAIVNLGITISDNMLSIKTKKRQNDLDQKIKDDLNQYIKLHRQCGISRETLASLYAMQDGVSSLGEGGLGMMDMIEMVAKLGQTDDYKRKPAITIISGNSCIRFHDKYCSFKQNDDLRCQFLNANGSAETSPDLNYILDMEYSFPGTIVTMRFSLDCDEQLRHMNQ